MLFWIRRGLLALHKRFDYYLNSSVCCCHRSCVDYVCCNCLALPRQARKQNEYKPNWAHSTKAEVIWWTIPIVIIGLLAIVTVRYTYDLEPSKPLAHEKEPITIQVSSLDWKWLFLYPEQGIATVNTLNIPADRPVKFELTADSPMNSFWIPQLGGQIYTMSGMAMTLYLQADHEGKYWGSGANFTGEHFGEMRFDVNATSDEEFDKWVAEVKQQSQPMTQDTYDALAKPGTSNVAYYSEFPEGLFQKIVTKYVIGKSAHSKHEGSSSNESVAGDKSLSVPQVNTSTN